MSSGRYRLVNLIAQGGMAEVYRARATGAEGFEKDVCVKRVLPHFARDADFVEMFKNEARLAAKLQHANIVQIFDFGEEGGTYYLAMEFVDGRDVRGWLDLARRVGQRLPYGLAAFIAQEAARGLGFAHQKREGGRSLGIVHRDVSPHNVLISRAGEVKIADFGIAKAASRAAATRSGVLKGKVAYMSPEQAKGGKVDARTDIFALGVVLHELLTGSRLFQADSETETLGRVLHGDIAPPSVTAAKVPAALDAIVMRALERDPAKRYGTMEELGRELSRFLFTLPPESATVEGLVAWLAAIEPTERPEVTSQTRVASDPGTAPTRSTPALLLRADAHEPTRAAEGATAQEHARPTKPLRPERERVITDGDTVAAAATSITRSAVREDPRKRRHSWEARVGGILAVLLAAGGVAWWLSQREATSSTRAVAAPPPGNPRAAPQPPAEPVRVPQLATSASASSGPARVSPTDAGLTAVAPATAANAAEPEASDAEETAKARKPIKVAKARDKEDDADLDETKLTEAASASARQRPPRKVPAAQLPAAPAPAPKLVEAPPPKPPKPAPPGYLKVKVIPWADIFIDGRFVSDMGRAREPLSPGVHQVRLRNKDRAYDQTFPVQIRSGEEARLDRDLN